MSKPPKKLIKKKNYVVANERGAVVELFCKNCGIPIGGLEVAEKENKKFERHGNYAEIKMRFSDGTFHVTNICTGCIAEVTGDPDLMQQIHDADIEQLALNHPTLQELYSTRTDPRCVGLDTKQRGMV